jgi:hypothetical protein
MGIANVSFAFIFPVKIYSVGKLGFRNGSKFLPASQKISQLLTLPVVSSAG